MKRRAVLCPLLIFFLACLIVPGKAGADMLNASTELDYSTFDSTIRDAAGNTMQTKSQDFNQRYFFNMNLSPVPTFKFDGNLILGKDLNDTETSTGDLRSSITTIQPSFSLGYADPFRIYSAGVGFTRLETVTRPENSPSATLVDDTYYGNFSWRPLEFPTLNLQVTHVDIYDKNRQYQDNSTDTVILSSGYAPIPALKLNYTADFTDMQDHITSLEVQTLIQTIGATYTGLFWDKRIFLTTGYTGNFETTDISQQGAGTVNSQLFPLAGLSGVTDTPLLDTLGQNAALIDGNLAVSAGINIGSSLTLSGDTKLREMAVDFFNPTDVNSVLIWVNEQLTPEIANSFSWDIYTSSDNQNWKFLQTVTGAPFGPFVNRFTINFQSVQTRYLKVVTRPLVITVQGATLPAYQNIFITQMQAFLATPAAQVRGTSTQTTHTVNASVRTQLLNGRTSLSHDFSFNGTDTSTTDSFTNGRSATYYTVSSGLNALHRFNSIWTGSGRLAWSESGNSAGERSDLYNWNALFSATPLKTLRGSVAYSGQILQNDQHTTTGNALGMNATADLYPGISMSIGGAANETDTNGETTDSLNANTSVGLVPNSRLTVNLSYGANRTRSSGGNLITGTASTSTLAQAGATFRPTDTVYLTASIARQSQSSAPAFILQNYGLNWSPFSGGTLQFYFNYNESARSDTDTLTKSAGPGLTWRLIPSATLDLSYAAITTKSPVETQDIKSLNAVFKMSL